MKTLEILKDFDKSGFNNFPKLTYSGLYKKIKDNFYFEFDQNDDKILLTPYYTILTGAVDSSIKEFIQNNETFLDSLKEFIINSLYIYSAVIEENSYYLTNPQSILIARMIHNRNNRFEIKFYSHYEDELQKSYNDKLYIGRDFINLDKFERKYFGLKKYFLSLTEQNSKIQERAKNRLRYFEDYKENYLNEIDYLTKEIFKESMARVKGYRETFLTDITKVKAQDLGNHIYYVLNLMIELKDFLQEFETKLRLREETSFVKYLTKFSKDVYDSIRYLRKLNTLIDLKITGFKYV